MRAGLTCDPPSLIPHSPLTRTREDTVKEVTQGLKVYFDKALGSILLYRFERLQYSELQHSHPDTEMSELYGAEHLLRLFGGWWAPISVSWWMALLSAGLSHSQITHTHTHTQFKCPR